GLVGYFGYDTVRYIEPRLARTDKPDALGTPDILLLLSEELAVIDNLLGKLYLVVYADPREPGAYARARRRLAELLARLRQPVAIPASDPCPSGPTACEFAEDAFVEAVERAKRYT
ncbi:anthranilate synthase component I, partial [Pelomicrobium sp. G1]